MTPNNSMEVDIGSEPNKTEAIDSKNDLKMKRGIECATNFEDILEAVGGFGNYQIFILVLLLILEIPTAFVTFISIFVGQVPQTWFCGNETISLAQACSCPNPTPLLEEMEYSIIAEWNLICDKEWVSDFITSIQMLGMFFGSVVGSQIADWYGRRLGFLGATLLLWVGSMASFYAPHPVLYAVARFLCGAGVTSFMNVTLVAVVEVMPTRWRSFSNCIGPTGEGLMILSVLSYFIRPWRTLYLVTLAPFGLIVIIYPFVPESPRWLLKQGRIDEASQVLQHMAQLNDCNTVVEADTLRRILEKESASNPATTRRWSYLDFLKDPKLRLTSLTNMGIWFAWSLTYYGISFNIKNIGGQLHTNVFLMGLTNAVGQRAALCLNNRLGRRKALFSSMTFTTGFLVVLAGLLLILGHSKVPPLLMLTLCLLGQFGMASARSSARLLSGESFPTAVRTMGLGIGGITANIAGILTPQLAYLGATSPSLPWFTFAAVSLGGSLISFLMSETMGRPLDEDGDNPEKDKTIKNKGRNLGLAAILENGVIHHFSGTISNHPDKLADNVNLVSISIMRDDKESEMIPKTGVVNPGYVSNDLKIYGVANTRTF